MCVFTLHPVPQADCKNQYLVTGTVAEAWSIFYLLMDAFPAQINYCIPEISGEVSMLGILVLEPWIAPGTGIGAGTKV